MNNSLHKLVFSQGLSCQNHLNEQGRKDLLKLCVLTFNFKYVQHFNPHFTDGTENMNNFWTEASSKGDMWIRAQRTTRMEWNNNENYQVNYQKVQRLEQICGYEQRYGYVHRELSGQ